MSNSNEVRPEIAAELEALRRSSNMMIRRSRALGLPIVTGDAHRVIHLDPHTMEEIPPDEVDGFIKAAQASWDE